MATHVDAIPALANRIADALYGMSPQPRFQRSIWLFPALRSTRHQIDRHSLLPLDLGRFARPTEEQPPLTTLSSEILLERLTAEYVYAQLCEAAMHAFAAENEARMMAMASAKTNIGYQAQVALATRAAVPTSGNHYRNRRVGSRGRSLANHAQIRRTEPRSNMRAVRLISYPGPAEMAVFSAKYSARARS